MIWKPQQKLLLELAQTDACEVKECTATDPQALHVGVSNLDEASLIEPTQAR